MGATADRGGGVEVHRDDLVPGGLGEVLERCEERAAVRVRGQDAGVVDDDVEAAQGLGGAVDEDGLPGVGEIAGYQDRGFPVAEHLVGSVLQRGPGAGGEGEPGPGLGERDGHGLPDAARGAGHQCAAAVEAEVVEDGHEGFLRFRRGVSRRSGRGRAGSGPPSR